ncbi:MAG: transglutaminase domain-containing protein [Phycisphaerales bacterium]|nr:transglutaminase domain-containing protein [Phycisphaerales bacterium]
MMDCLRWSRCGAGRAVGTFLHRPSFRGGRCFILAMLLAAAPVPKDEPPLPPLTRTSPRLYDLTVSIAIPWNQTMPPRNGGRLPLRWPMLPRSNWSFMTPETLWAELTHGPSKQQDEHAWSMAEESTPPGQWSLDIPMPARVQGSPIEVQIRYRTNTFSCTLDEAAARSIAWPDAWPSAVSPFLDASEFVESDNPLFAAAVQDALRQEPRSAPLHLVAKSCIRYCLQHVRSTGSYMDTGRTGIRGFTVQGAVGAAEAGTGSACDLVCVCVATLRAAGIPARPVIGATSADTVGLNSTQPRYMVWGEYYLPGAGWIPFDPKRLQGTVDRVPLQDVWQGLGTMQFLNRRVPLGYSFVIGGTKRAYDAIGPWSWVPIVPGRPLPVPLDLEYLPTVQNLNLVFVGSGQMQPQ